MFNWKLDNNTLTLSGILDKTSGVELWKNRSALFNSATLLNIELSQLEKTDSAGLATLIALFKEAKDNQISLKILNSPQQLLDIAKVSGIEKILPFQ